VRRLRASVVVPSLRPNESLLRLLLSLEEQRFEFSQIVIVDQSDNLEALELLKAYRGPLSNCLEVIRSSPGLARARNAGLLHLNDRYDVVLVPDDDVWLASDASNSITDAIQDGVMAGSGRLTSEGSHGGARIAFPATAVEISERNVWQSSIEACYFFTPSYLTQVGLYDEKLGLGASSPWQSGEGTDLLLRGIAAGMKTRFLPEYELVEGKAAELDPDARRSRLRKYARGTGRVYARNYSTLGCVKLIIKSAARLVVHSVNGRQAARDNWQILLGRVEGLLGRLL